MAKELLSVQVLENRVKHIISGEFSDGRKFDAGKVLEILFLTYKTFCSYEELADILDKLVNSEKLVCLVPGRTYKIKPKA